MESDLKPWYLSKTVWGGVLAVAASILNLAGIELSDGDQATLADQVTALRDDWPPTGGCADRGQSVREIVGTFICHSASLR